MNNIDRIRKLQAIRLKLLRVEKGLTQAQLSKLSNVGRHTIIAIESGEKGVNGDSMLLIEDTLKNYKAPE